MSVRLLHGDALTQLRLLPDASVDAIVTDPPYELGFMGKRWDGSGIAYSVELWAECLRVLKSGGHLAAFGGTRTYHRMACAVEDAGFHIQDSLIWLHGQGFPKGKSQLKPAQEPIVLARKRGPAGLNIDATRVGSEVRTRIPRGIRPGHDNYVGDDWRPDQIAPKEYEGRWPANVLLSHSPECRGPMPSAEDIAYDKALAEEYGRVFAPWLCELDPDMPIGCAPGCPVAELDAQSGTLTSGANPTRRSSDKFRGTYSDYKGQAECTPARDTDSGDASRFFPTFRYQAKAPTRERPKVDGIAHPTVKPLALMQWLVRLLCPPGGLVLDPFAGSGTTLQAARDEGMRAIGIEREADYLPLIVARLAS